MKNNYFTSLKNYRKENEELKLRIDQLEWENKGIGEWRDEWERMRIQRDTKQRRIEEMEEALFLAYEALNTCRIIAIGEDSKPTRDATPIIIIKAMDKIRKVTNE